MDKLNYCSNLKPDSFAAKADDEAGVIEGYFALYNTPSEPIWDAYVWEIAEGAFDKSFKEKKNQFILAHHDFTQVIGSREAKTCEIKADDKGFWGRASVPDTSYGRDLLISMKRGDIKATSFGFNILKSQFVQEKKYDKQVLLELDVWEGSAVTIPRFSATNGKIKALIPASVPAPLQASLFRALNRAEHELEFDDSDREILNFFSSMLRKNVPTDFEAKLEKRGIKIAAQNFEVSKGPDPLAYKLWLDNIY